MAISYSSGATASASLGSTQLTGVQRVEQQQLQAAGQVSGQSEGTADPGQASATTNGGEGPSSDDPTRGSNVDVAV